MFSLLWRCIVMSCGDLGSSLQSPAKHTRLAQPQHSLCRLCCETVRERGGGGLQAWCLPHSSPFANIAIFVSALDFVLGSIDKPYLTIAAEQENSSLAY